VDDGARCHLRPAFCSVVEDYAGKSISTVSAWNGNYSSCPDLPTGVVDHEERLTLTLSQ
jgi:hypothetical protein